ncbi:MAG: DUF72 domain-containing protein [Kutzneria sp.]|nr:DUF72 domain-containing protein [Kutzneria sp.]
MIDGVIRVGTSGWVYPEWRGVFYPKGLPQRRELEYLSRRVNSIEINGSFYSLRQPSNYRAWAATTPDDFVFAVKGIRQVTHVKRLRNIERPLADFFASGVLELGHKLGPVLWQLPPSVRFDPEVLDGFLRLLPRTVRHALEVRHPSFRDPTFFRLMHANNVASVVADTAGTWPRFDEITADFVYVRLHGDEELYASGYTDRALDRWASRIRDWARDRDAFVYFDNTMRARAPHDAVALASRLDTAAP